MNIICRIPMKIILRLWWRKTPLVLETSALNGGKRLTFVPLISRKDFLILIWREAERAQSSTWRWKVLAHTMSQTSVV